MKRAVRVQLGVLRARRLKRAVGVLVAAAVGIAARSAAAQCTPRPTDPGGTEGVEFGAPEKTYDTGSIRVHYTISGTHAVTPESTRGDGVPDMVAHAGDTAEDALGKFTAMGFRKPPSDMGCSSNGGDGKLDIYLVKFPNADGSTKTASCDGRACSSFLLCESTFFGKGYPSVKEGFTTVVVHELFHAVQNAYDQGMDRFWAEGTAQWAMKKLHPELVDFERQLPAFFKEPGRSIDTQPMGAVAGYLYGSAVWPLFLSLKYGDDTIQKTLEAQADGTSSLAAVDKTLGAKGESLAKAFPTFAAWNVGTGERTGTGGYPDGAKYPAVSVKAGADGTEGITTGFSYTALSIDPGGTAGVSLETDVARNAGVLVPLEGGKANLDKAAFLPANADGPTIVVIAGITPKKTDAKWVLRIGAPVASSSSSSSSGGGGDEGGCSVGGGAPGGFAGGLAGLAVIAIVRRRRR